MLSSVFGAASFSTRVRLEAQMTPCSWSAGDTFHEPGERVESVVVVEGGLLSTLLPLASDGRDEGLCEAGVEVNLLGRGQVSALSATLSGLPMPFLCIAQLDGEGWRLPAGVLREEFARDSELQKCLLREITRQLTHVAQCALCNRLHTVEERLARWLLEVRDATGQSEFALARTFLASMLGTRLSSVPLALGLLWRSGIIECDHDLICIPDASRLQGCACSCYCPKP